MEINLKVDGLKELEQELLKLGNDISFKILRGATNEALKPMADTAKSLVPVDRGVLRRSIRRSSRIDKRGKGAIATAKLIAGGKVKGDFSKARARKKYGDDAFYAMWQEFGTKKMAAQPFLTPAFERHKQQAIMILKEKIAERIAKVKAKK